MSSEHRPTDTPASSQPRGPAGLSDPNGRFEFAVTIPPTTGTGRRAAVGGSQQYPSHYLTASREVAGASGIPQVGPTTPSLVELVDRLAGATIVDDTNDPVTEAGTVTVATDFAATAGSGYDAVDVRLAGASLNAYDISAGRWTVSDELCDLIDRQSSRSVVVREVYYAGTGTSDPAPLPARNR